MRTNRSSIVSVLAVLTLLGSMAGSVRAQTADPSPTMVRNDSLAPMPHQASYFLLNQSEHARQTPYYEDIAMIDFNRVTGFFLGLGSPRQLDLGTHNEVGITAAGGYGFEDKRWEYVFGGELRLPLESVEKLRTQLSTGDSSQRYAYMAPPTLAIGLRAENITSTDDAWRTGRAEIGAEAFFAREDFRDYYKLAGWNAYIALRGHLSMETRIEWRSDHYQSLSQLVWHGRWGGNKTLPYNPPVAEGRMNSLVLTEQRESAHSHSRQVTNVFGDTVMVEQMVGTSSMLQVELGHMPGSDFGFNRYTLDARHFLPLTNGVSFDTRFRFESTTGDMLPQKLEYLGGPSTLPALANKSVAGNRMLLLNTEIRLSPVMLTSVVTASDLNLIIFNDLGKVGVAGLDGESIFKGFGFSGASSILYNVGVGIGWTKGVQFGMSWPTNTKGDPRYIFRLQRAF